MKALLLKDWYMAKRYFRSYLLIVAVFAVVAVVGNNAIMLFYPAMLAGIMPINLIAYEERDRWELYAGTLPYSRKEIVTSKYIDMLIACGLGSVFVAVVNAVRMVFGGGIDLTMFFLLSALIPVVGILCPCLSLPFVFKYGAEKGRLYMFVIQIGIFVLAGMAGAVAGENPDMAAAGFEYISAAVVIAVIALAAALFLLSWRISVRMYQKREIG